jgi:hypothetical protein
MITLHEKIRAFPCPNRVTFLEYLLRQRIPRTKIVDERKKHFMFSTIFWLSRNIEEITKRKTCHSYSSHVVVLCSTQQWSL